MSKKRKVRTDFRKNREVRTRQNDLTARYQGEDIDDASAERVRAKGRLSRKRTVAGAEIIEDDSGRVILPEIDPEKCLKGRVLRVQGLVSVVEADSGQHYHCATRKLLKSLSTDQRHVIAAGDLVWFRPETQLVQADRDSGATLQEGLIERVEPRRGVLSRTSRGRQHVMVANVDQLIIVASAAEPRLKPNLIDRLLITAERARVKPLVCVNKIDLIQPAALMPLIGIYGRLGYQVLLLSAKTGVGMDRMRSELTGKQSVLTGQSGVGKSSLLNAIQPELGLRVSAVSQETQKGRHTTTTAELIRLDCEFESALGTGQPRVNGPSYVVDTPGIRQFELWDVIAEEVPGYFRDLRPFVSQCRFPDCTHTHEAECAVKDAVADGWIDMRRYESYVQIRSGD